MSARPPVSPISTPPMLAWGRRRAPLHARARLHVPCPAALWPPGIRSGASALPMAPGVSHGGSPTGVATPSSPTFSRA